MASKQDGHPFRNKFTFLFFAFSFGMLVSALIFKLTSHPEISKSLSLITYNGIDMTIKDLPMSIATPLYQAEVSAYNKEIDFLKEAGIEFYVADQARKQKKPVDEVRQSLFETTPVTDAEVNAFFKENKKNISRPFYEIKDQIHNYLTQKKVQKKLQDLLAKLKKEGNFAILLKSPESPIVQIDTKGYPVAGNPKSAVKVVEFADYQCPHCFRANITFQKLLKKHGKQFQLVYMDFPINPTGISRVVAEGAVCADQQGKFWPYHDLAFQKQRTLSKASPLQFAKLLSLKMDSFKSCLALPSTAQKVRTSEKLAIKLGSTGTPTIFINGRVFEGRNLDSDLEKAILNPGQYQP